MADRLKDLKSRRAEILAYIRSERTVGKKKHQKKAMHELSNLDRRIEREQYKATKKAYSIPNILKKQKASWRKYAR